MGKKPNWFEQLVLQYGKLRSTYAWLVNFLIYSYELPDIRQLIYWALGELQGQQAMKLRMLEFTK